jgi:hypothetical protein
MKYTVTALAALVVAGGLAAPAFATVTVTADIAKSKDISVTEHITITKTATISVILGTETTNNGVLINPITLPGAAEAHALANVTNTGNIVGPNFVGHGTSLEDIAPQDVHDLHRFAEIGPGGGTGSVNANEGIIGVNQDTGDNSNQGNLVSLAFTEVGGSFANSEAGGDQSNTNNTVDHRQQTLLPEILGTPGNPADPRNLDNQFFDLIARIEGSVSGNTGIVGVNQNSGNMNNQTNAVAAAIGVNPTLALGEGALGQVNSGNTVRAENTVKYDEIGNGSVSGNSGVVGVNQSVGDMNNQMNAFSIAAATTANAPVTTLVGGPVPQ